MTLYLQGNQIQSIDHIIDCLDDFNNLKEVVFMQNEDTNPVCNHPKYRSLLVSMLGKIQALDGFDRSGQPVEADYWSDNLGLTGTILTSDILKFGLKNVVCLTKLLIGRM